MSTRATALALGIVVSAVQIGSAEAARAPETVHAFLWDAGDQMKMVSDLGIGNADDHVKATMGVALSTSTVNAGEVTFEVDNESAVTVHEMVLIALDSPNDSMPYDAKTMSIDEETAHSLGEVSELEPGAGGKLTVNMKPGKYALICNVPGHYKSGMWSILTVK
jgi:uncharacterized cupredoxin-like copper-binding protein